MTTAVEIARAVRQNLRRPTHQQLAHPTLLRAMSDCQRRILREAQLSDRGWLETSALVIPSSLDDLLNLDNFSVPTRVEYRVAPDVDYWYPVSIVNHDQVYDRIGDSVTFYGNPPRITYSAASINDLVGREYRIWYETSPSVIAQLVQQIEVSDIFSDLLTDEATVYCLPLVENDSPEWERFCSRQLVIVAARILESKRQWMKWVNMSREQGIVYADGFQAGYAYDEAAHLGPGGTHIAS